MPPLPAAAAELWAWFGELDAARGSTGWGPAPIGWAELDAWQRVGGQRLTAWEAGTLMALDAARLRHLGNNGNTTGD